MAASTAQLHYIAPRHAEKAVYRPTNDGVKQFASFKKIGYGLDERRAYQMYKACFGLDNLPGNITTPSIPTFIQFLQAWLPGNVEVITAARKADILLGVMTAGSWSDEEIVQKISERLGVVVPYSDFGNSPISSWNLNAEKRHIVRFEAAIRVGTLEEDRAAAMQIAAGAERRDAAGTGLEIARNKVAFFGFNGGNNQTYGLLNDPNLPAYVGVPNGGSGFSQWATKTFEEIVKDALTALSALRINSKDVIDPKRTPITYALPTAAIDYLSTPSAQYGYTVQQWFSQNYPNVRFESAPELDGAVGGLNAAYLYAETVADSGSDNGRAIDQIVQMKFMVTGVVRLSKGYEEAYTNATAGVLVKRPYAVYRQSGI